MYSILPKFGLKFLLPYTSIQVQIKNSSSYSKGKKISPQSDVFGRPVIIISSASVSFPRHCNNQVALQK